jgi:hypothetical protein
MKRELPGGYELDDAVDRIDVDAVHRYISEESYWLRHTKDGQKPCARFGFDEPSKRLPERTPA